MKTKIIAIIEGGVLCDVFSSSPGVEVELIDWDNVREGDYENEKEREDAIEHAEELEKQARETMNCVF